MDTFASLIYRVSELKMLALYSFGFNDYHINIRFLSGENISSSIDSDIASKIMAWVIKNVTHKSNHTWHLEKTVTGFNLLRR